MDCDLSLLVAGPLAFTGERNGMQHPKSLARLYLRRQERKNRCFDGEVKED